MGTSYGERSVAENRSSNFIIRSLEREWIYHHGAPQFFSSDPEFCNQQLNSFLKSHNIELEVRPSRSSHKNGKVERNNGIFKTVFIKVAAESKLTDIDILVKRASFITNLLHGNSILSSFQLARGYSPSVLCIPAKVVPSNLLIAYKQTSASRAVNKLLRSHQHLPLTRQCLPAGTDVWIYYNTSKQNERTRWVKGKVVETHQHYVTCRRSMKGQPMKVAYEDIRLAPKGELAAELQAPLVEDIFDRPQTPLNSQPELISDVATKPQLTPATATNQREDQLQDKALDELLSIDSDNSDTELPPLHRNFFSGNAKLNIGYDSVSGPSASTGHLCSQEQLELNKLYAVIGKETVSRKKLEGAPFWLIDKAVKEEVEDAWKDAFTEVSEQQVPFDANIISSHIIYKIKIDEKGTKRLKARLCPHGNRDRGKGTIRSDSSNVQFDIMRLLLSLTTVFRFRLGCIDVKAAYLQSGPIARDLYVRPPTEYKHKRGSVWKLSKLPYGVCEAGRQWAKTIESWLTHQGGFQRLSGVSQLYIKRKENGTISLLLGKLTDDLLIAGARGDMENFAIAIKARFLIGKVVIDDTIMFNGCTINQTEEGDIQLRMSEYLKNISPTIISPGATRDLEKATDTEIQDFRRLAGELLWLGSSALPQAAYFGSLLQQRVPNLTKAHILEANRALTQLKRLDATVTFKTPPVNPKEVELVSFSDASFNITSRQVYGQTGGIAGIRYIKPGDDARIIHFIDWTSHKQRRVCYSSYGAEIIAICTAEDRGFALKQALAALFPNLQCTHQIRTDSKALFDTVTTLHDGKKYRLRQTVQQIRDAFESRELNQIRWIQKHANIADALTKYNAEMHKLLNRATTTGFLDLPNHLSHKVDSSTWTWFHKEIPLWNWEECRLHLFGHGRV